MEIKDDETEFVEKAKKFTARAGAEAVLLVVGSRAAGLSDSWSDIDMWVVGDKSSLTPDEFAVYEKEGELFVDRGDYGAHWKFYDRGDLLTALQVYPDEIMWVISTAQVLAGSDATARSLKQCCFRYPKDVAQEKLKWHFGHYWSALGPLNLAARGIPEAGFLMAGKVIEWLCKICCLAECKPFPYAKWLVSVARTTVLGQKVFPLISEAVFGIEEFLHPPKDKDFRDLVPLARLRATKSIVGTTLRELGWNCSWIDNTDEAVAEALRMGSPKRSRL